MALDYKKLSDDRRELLNQIRLLVKKNCPHFFQVSCFQQSIIDVLTAVFEERNQIEKGRDAFRDELMRHGYTHDDLVKLLEKDK